MNKALLVLNIVLLIAVGTLFFLFFKNRQPAAREKRVASTVDSLRSNSFRIAYFEMDSVEQNFSMAKEMQQELAKQQDQKAARLNALQRTYQSKLNNFQKMENMTQQQYEAAQKEMANLENQIRNASQKADQDANDYFMKKQQEILAMIREFFQEYNKDYDYAYIFASEPGLIFLKDSAYNITPDLLEGLDSMQKAKKK